MEIITGLPAWLAIVCIVLAGAYAWVLYYFQDRLFSTLQPWLKRTMTLFRFLSVFLLSFLLLSPLIKLTTFEIEKPIVVLAQDNSSSIIQHPDSAYYRQNYPAELTQLRKALEVKYDVKTYSFGQHISADIKGDYQDKQSDLSALFDQLGDEYTNRNLCAVIMASDGLYNQGSNPLYSSEKLKVPVYTIALGDTLQRKDILISKVEYNRKAYLNNSFPLQIRVNARQASGSSLQLTVSRDEKVLFTKPVIVSSSNFETLIPVFLDADKAGVQVYTITISSVAGEITTANNSYRAVVEVLENKEKIAILYSAAHPDISALKQCLESTSNYEVKVFAVDEFKEKLSAYNLVVLHQIPSSVVPAKALFDQLKIENTPIFFIAGSNSNMLTLGSLNLGLQVKDINGRTNELYPSVNRDFSLFTLSELSAKAINQFPPSLSLFGSYSSNAGNANTLVYQRIGNVLTNQPLLFFSKSEQRKCAFLLGEGLWRWRLRDYLVNGSSAASDELLTKCIQYLSAPEEKKPFRIIGKPTYNEGDPILFDAELYNENFELINTPDASLTITDKSGKAYPFVFSRSGKAYTLNVGSFPIGQYRYKAQVKLGDKIYLQQNSFSVVALQLEALSTKADHALLKNIAEKSGAKMVYPEEMQKLAQLLADRTDIKPMSFSMVKLDEWISLRWLFVVFLLLLSAEWFLRKYHGGY